MNPQCKMVERPARDRVVANKPPFDKNRNRAPTKVQCDGGADLVRSWKSWGGLSADGLANTQKIWEPVTAVVLATFPARLRCNRRNEGDLSQLEVLRSAGLTINQSRPGQNVFIWGHQGGYI